MPSLDGVGRTGGRRALALAVALATTASVLALGVFRDGAIFPSERPPLAISLLALGAAGWMLERRWRDVPPGPMRGEIRAGRVALAGLAAFAAWSLLSSWWSLVPGRSVWMGLVYAGGIVAFSAGARLRAISWATVPVLMLVLAGIGAAVSWISLVGYGLEWSSYLGVIDGVPHALGPFGYANSLASLVVLTLPATAWTLFFSVPGLLARAVIGGAAALQVWALVITHSRGAVAALAAGLVCVAAAAAWRGAGRVEARSRRRAARGLLAFALVAACVGVGVFGWQRLGGYSFAPVSGTVQAAASDPSVDADSDAPSMTPDGYRVRTWVAAVSAIREKPALGWGVDTFYEAYAPFKPGAETRFAHNLLVQLAVELGLLGVALLVLAVGPVLLSWAVVVLRGPIRDPGVWLGASVFAFLAQNLVDLTWFVPALFYLLWVCAGGVTARPVPSENPPAPGASRRGGRGGEDPTGAHRQ